MTADAGIRSGPCPDCADGRPGKDSLCDPCWREYLGTHVGGGGEDRGQIIASFLAQSDRSGEAS